jgi:hypothetical protein
LFLAVAIACLLFYAPKTGADPNDRIILLLTRLVADSENPNNASARTPIPDWEETKKSFRPSDAAAGLSDCLFTSLYLSLTVVLIGVTALQWIWEHEQYPDLTPKQHFAILQMCKEALSKWGVPQMIQILPSLLLVALVSFLVALWNPDNGRVSIFAQYLLNNFSLCFFTFTTFLPIFQEYLLYLPCLDVRREEMPIPCPHRSNQSRFFRRLLTSTKANSTDLNNCFQAVLTKEDSDLSHFPACSLSSTIQHPSLDILKDENMFLYLKAVVDRSCRRTRDGRPSWPAFYSTPQQLIITKHFAELRVRVKAYFYSEISEQFKVHANQELDLDEPWDISFLPLFDSPGDDEMIGMFFISSSM